MPDVPTRPGTFAAARLPGIGLVLAGQAGYQLRLLTRTPRALWLAIFVPAGVLALRLGHTSDVGSHPGAGSAVYALVAGLAVFGLLNTAYMTHASGLVSARQDGVLRRWRLTPLPAGGYFAGRIAATVLLADAGGALVILTGAAMAGVRVSASATLILLATLSAGALAWAALGTAVTIVVPTAEAAFPVLSLTYLPVIFLSGAFGAFAGEPNWLTTLIRYLPAQPLVEAVTWALRPSASGLAAFPGRDLAVLAAWGAAGLLVSVRFFRWNPQRPAHGRHQPSRPTGSMGH
ncbi:MAG TPA: ABC transporter permease [Streptosporangiaceae bacterium]